MLNSGAERWQQIVDNTAALVAEMDSGLVPAVEAASWTPREWYRLEKSAITTHRSSQPPRYRKTKS